MMKTALLIAITVLVAVWLSSLYHLGVAHAAPLTPTDNALGDPLGFYEYVAALWRSGAILSTVIVTSLGILKVLQARVAWFQQGHRIVVVSAVIGALSLLADSLSNGGSPNLSMIVVAIVTVVAAVIPAKHAPEDAKA